MTEAEWQTRDDPDTMVRALDSERYQRELRLFTVACARRIWPLLSDASRAALNASEQFAEGTITEPKLAEMVAVAEQDALKAVPGHSAPDARDFAASAAVDASSVWTRTASNVLSSTSCAASAAACAAAEADELHYDEVFDATRRRELAAQAEMLRTLFHFPGE